MVILNAHNHHGGFHSYKTIPNGRFYGAPIVAPILVEGLVTDSLITRGLIADQLAQQKLIQQTSVPMVAQNTLLLEKQETPLEKIPSKESFNTTEKSKVLQNTKETRVPNHYCLMFCCQSCILKENWVAILIILLILALLAAFIFSIIGLCLNNIYHTSVGVSIFLVSLILLMFLWAFVQPELLMPSIFILLFLAPIALLSIWVWKFFIVFILPFEVIFIFSFIALFINA